MTYNPTKVSAMTTPATSTAAPAPQTTNPALVADALSKCIGIIGQIMLKRQADPTWIVPANMMSEVRTATLAIGEWYIEVETVSTKATLKRVGVDGPYQLTLTMTVLGGVIWEYSCTS